LAVVSTQGGVTMSTETLSPTEHHEAPAIPTPAHTDSAQLIRDALRFDVIEPVPQGWSIYTTQKFLGRTALMAYAAEIASVGLAPLLFRGNWIPVIFAPEALIYGAPLAFAGAWLEWNAPAEPDLSQQRTWPGRLATLAAAYLAMLAIAGLFHLFWVTIVSYK